MPETGTAEILFRRVGENEATAIETCRALVQAKRRPDVKAIEDDPATRYAQTLVGAHDSGKDVPANNDESSGPFHGYSFRMLTAPHTSGVGAKRNLSDAAAATGYAFIAYPTEYRYSGVLTFVVTQDGVLLRETLAQTRQSLPRESPSKLPLRLGKRLSN